MKEFYEKKPWMDNAYIIMRALHHHMTALCNAPFNMPLAPSRGNLRSCLQEERSHGCKWPPLYCHIGALLNPHLIKDMELCDDQQVIVGLMKAFQKFFDNTEEFQAMKVKFNLYFQTMSPYYREYIWSPMEMKEIAHVWWFTNNSIGKLLPCIA